jgi:hypothetical protein
MADKKKQSPERELTELLQHQTRLERRERSLPEQSLRRIAELRALLAAKTSDALAAGSPEKKEKTEREKVNESLKDGQKNRWIDVQDMGDPKAEKQCVILGSGHYMGGPNTLNAATFQNLQRAQFQFFAQLHLLQRHNVKVPLLVEGSRRGPIFRPNITINFPNGNSFPLHSSEAQKHFLRHPEHFMQFQHDMQKGGRPINFTDLSTYPHIEGAHSPEVDDTLQHVSRLQLNEKNFELKYMPPPGATAQVVAEMKDGRWQIFLNSKWVSPEELLADAKGCLQFQDELDAFNIVREDECVEHFAAADPARMPLVWVGLAHVQPIAEKCVERGMFVKKVTPVSHRAITTLPNSRPVATQLKDFAEQYVLANQIMEMRTSP